MPYTKKQSRLEEVEAARPELGELAGTALAAAWDVRDVREGVLDRLFLMFKKFDSSRMIILDSYIWMILRFYYLSVL